MQHYNALTNSQLAELIGENIHSERDRKILRLRLIEGYTYEKISDIMEMSPRYLRTLVHRLADRLQIASK